MFADTFAQDHSFWAQRVDKEERSKLSNPLINSPRTGFAKPYKPKVQQPAPLAMPPCPIRSGFRQWPYEIPRLPVPPPSRGGAFGQLGAEPLVHSGGFGTCQRVGHLHRGPAAADPSTGAGMAAWLAPPRGRPMTVTATMSVEPVSPPGMKSFAESFASSPRHNHLPLQQESPIFRPGAAVRPRADLSPTTWQASRSWPPAGSTEQQPRGMGGFR